MIADRGQWKTQREVQAEWGMTLEREEVEGGTWEALPGTQHLHKTNAGSPAPSGTFPIHILLQIHPFLCSLFIPGYPDGSDTALTSVRKGRNGDFDVGTGSEKANFQPHTRGHFSQAYKQDRSRSFTCRLLQLATTGEIRGE